MTFDSTSHSYDEFVEVTCPNGHPQIHRVYSAPAIIFKGSGFYVSDSRKSQPKRKSFKTPDQDRG